jgi:hypothetical protein
VGGPSAVQRICAARRAVRRGGNEPPVGAQPRRPTRQHDPWLPARAGLPIDRLRSGALMRGAAPPRGDVQPGGAVDRAAFLRTVLARTQRLARLRQVFVAVRSYQQETEALVESLGFGREFISGARSGTRRRGSNRSIRDCRRAPFGVRERLPKQVPTFLKRRPPGRDPRCDGGPAAFGSTELSLGETTDGN